MEIGYDGGLGEKRERGGRGMQSHGAEGQMAAGETSIRSKQRFESGVGPGHEWQVSIHQPPSC